MGTIHAMRLAYRKVKRMYITQISLYGTKVYPLAISMIYGKIAEMYQLPSIETLAKSIRKDVEWPNPEKFGLEVYYLEDMINVAEQSIDGRTVFQIRFNAGKDARAKTSIYVSIDENGVARNLSITYPGTQGKYSASNVLAIIKSVMHTLGMKTDEMEYEISGFAEGGPAKDIREHSLSAFIWIDALSRYLHVRERLEENPDYRKGYRRKV